VDTVGNLITSVEARVGPELPGVETALEALSPTIKGAWVDTVCFKCNVQLAPPRGTSVFQSRHL
jgi:hypothetical protein